MENRYVIGIDVGGTKTAYGVFDENKQIIKERREPSDASLTAEAFFDGIIAAVDTLCAECGITRAQLAGIGIGVPSFIRWEDGFLINTPTLPNIREFPATEYMTARLGGVPVLFDNDGRTAALAEHRNGAGRGFTNMIYCPVSTGISSAIVINNAAFRGSYGFAGESGHALATPGEGIQCGCGQQGCYMSYCSGAMIVRHIQNWIAAGDATIMAELAGGASKITTVHIGAAYSKGDAMAQRAVEQMARYLATWLFNLYMTLNINCFVLGGGLLKMNAPLLARIREIFDGYNQNDYPVYFKEAELGDACGIIGAAELFF